MSKAVAQNALSEYTAMIENLTWGLECLADVHHATNSRAVGESSGRGQVYMEQFKKHKRELRRLLCILASKTE